jgi:hypothetical protein
MMTDCHIRMGEGIAREEQGRLVIEDSFGAFHEDEIAPQVNLSHRTSRLNEVHAAVIDDNAVQVPLSHRFDTRLT